MTTEAHDQKLTLHLIAHYPEHEPRTGDPHYAAFNATKRRMHAAGLMVCAIPGCKLPGPIELHHSRVEFAMQNGVDLGELNALYGLHLESEEEFKVWLETDASQLLPLCPAHHRGHLGVHVLPEPFWAALRVWKVDMAPPAEETPA